MPMSLVTVKKKFQVVIPAQVRRKVGIKVGDLLEAKVQRGTITLKPQSVIDRDIAESLEDFKKGRVYGPFESAEEMIASLHAHAKRLRSRKKAARTRP